MLKVVAEGWILAPPRPLSAILGGGFGAGSGSLSVCRKRLLINQQLRSLAAVGEATLGSEVVLLAIVDDGGGLHALAKYL